MGHRCRRLLATAAPSRLSDVSRPSRRFPQGPRHAGQRRRPGHSRAFRGKRCPYKPALRSRDRFQYLGVGLVFEGRAPMWASSTGLARDSEITRSATHTSQNNTESYPCKTAPSASRAKTESIFWEFFGDSKHDEIANCHSDTSCPSPRRDEIIGFDVSAHLSEPGSFSLPAGVGPLRASRGWAWSCGGPPWRWTRRRKR